MTWYSLCRYDTYELTITYLNDDPEYTRPFELWITNLKREAITSILQDIFLQKILCITLTCSDWNAELYESLECKLFFLTPFGTRMCSRVPIAARVLSPKSFQFQFSNTWLFAFPLFVFQAVGCSNPILSSRANQSTKAYSVSI